jgi:hypothetical protein
MKMMTTILLLVRLLLYLLHQVVATVILRGDIVTEIEGRDDIDITVERKVIQDNGTSLLLLLQGGNIVILLMTLLAVQMIH